MPKPDPLLQKEIVQTVAASWDACARAKIELDEIREGTRTAIAQSRELMAEADAILAKRRRGQSSRGT